MIQRLRPKSIAAALPLACAAFLSGCGGDGPQAPEPPPTDAPAVHGFSPLEGEPGDSITVFGERFTLAPGSMTLSVGTASTVVAAAADSVLRAAVPASASTGPVVATTAGGSGASDLYFIVYVSGQPAPAITAISPASATVGSAVTLSGQNFSADPRANHVTFNGVLAEVTSASENALVAVVPAGATPGPVALATAGGRVTATVPFLLLTDTEECANPTEVTGVISGPATWTTAGCPYILRSDVTLASSATLTIQAGVVIKLDGPSTRFLIDGTLRAQGTPSDPVIFTSYRDDATVGDTNGDGGATTPAPGDWGAVEFSPGSQAELASVVALYGGGLGSGGFDLDARATLSRCTFARMSGYGLAAAAAPVSVSISQCTFYGNHRPLLVHPGVSLGTTNSFSAAGQPANEQNAIFLVPGGVTAPGALAWSETDVPYAMVVEGVKSNVIVASGTTLTISPGVVVKLLGEAADLAVYGQLQAVGQPASPIVITSFVDDTAGGDTNGDGTATNPARGNWDALDLAGGSRSTLRHVRIRYGGARALATEGQVCVADGAYAEFDSCTVERGVGSGISLFGGAGRVRSCTIRNHWRWGIRCASGDIWYLWGGQTLISGNTFSSNESAPPDVYVVMNAPGAPLLTLPAGVR